MNTIPFDRSRFESKVQTCYGKVKYKMGAKPPLNGVAGKDFTQSDCSGFVRWILWLATNGHLILPSGSWYQWEWCKDRDFKPTAGGYAEGAALHDRRLRIAFFGAKRGRAGHVWLILNGNTYESYGGRGVGSRKWDTPVLLKNVEACYVLA
jgi:cell wall-associated NlpC family hydrolase